MAKKEISYNDAFTEIEDILYDIESQDIDPDMLSEKVKRVSFLISHCKRKLLDTEKLIDSIFDDKDQ
jgi:exodeoxyribonuclease VII small subunit